MLNEDASDSFISIVYLKDILLSLGDNMTQEEMNYFMEEIEVNENDEFDYIKFVNNVIKLL